MPATPALRSVHDHVVSLLRTLLVPTLMMLFTASRLAAQPNVWAVPGGGYVYTQSVSVTIWWCSSTSLSGASRTIFLNGVSVKGNFNYVSQSGCGQTYSYKSVGTISLNAGSNTLEAGIYATNGSYGSTTNDFNYQPPVTSVVVTNNGASTLGVGQTTSLVARTYIAGGTEVFQRQVLWSSGGGVSLSPTSGASASTTTVTATSASSASVTATSGGVSSSAQGISVVNPTYVLSISPSSPSTFTLAPGATSTGTKTFQVTNASTYTSASASFNLTATPSGVIAPCTVSPASGTLPPSGSLSVDVTCPVGTTTSASSPTVTFRAAMTSPGSDVKEQVTTYNVSPSYSFGVGFVGGSSSVTHAAHSTSGSAGFLVINNSVNTGTTNVSYTASCGGVAGCTPVSSSVAVAAGTSATINVPYSVSWQGVNGSVTFGMTSPSGTLGAVKTVYTTPYYGGVTVSGTGSQTIPQGNSSGTTNYTVTNDNKNVGPVSYTLTRSCSTPLLSNCGGTPPSPMQLNDQASAAATASYNVSLSESSGTVSLTAASSSPAATHSKTTTLTATPVYGLANVSIAYADRYRDVSRCVADCFEVTAAYSSPMYRSLDVERGATLLYRSGRARPLGTIVLDVTDPSITPVATYSLRLHRPNGTEVTFTNNSSVIFFAGGPGATRLVAQFDASTYSTGSFSFTALVHSHWPDGTVLVRPVAVRVLIQNSINSSLGAGWEVAQLQRAWVLSDGIVVASGDGSLSHFTDCSGTCTMVPPPGDPTTLQRLGDGRYMRTYLDGTKLTFSSFGFLTDITDRLGNRDSVIYDGNGLLTAIKDPLGYGITFAYNGGKLSSITAPAVSGGGRSSAFAVNVAGDLVQATDVDGIVNFVGTYDGSHRLTNLKDRRGGNWGTSYGADDGVLTATAPKILASGDSVVPTTTIHAPARRLFVSIANDSGKVIGTAISRAVDLRGWIRGPRGDTTFVTINRFGFATRTDLPDTTFATADFDPTTAVITRSAAPSGHVQRFTWTNYLLTKVVDSTRADSVRIKYATFARPDTIFGPVTQTFTYNDATRQFTVKSGTQPAAIYAYDTFGRTTQVTDPGGHITKSYYGASGLRNLDSTEVAGIPAPRRTKLRYDGYGRAVATVFPDGRRDSVVYDLIDRVTHSIDAKNGITAFGYDSLYLRTVTDARSKVTTYFVNPLGWMESELRPGSSEKRFIRYDVAGNVIGTTDRRDSVVAYTYDLLDRLRTRVADGDTARFDYRIPTVSLRGFASQSNALSTDIIYVNAKDQTEETYSARPNGWYRAAYTYTTKGGRLAETRTTSDKWSDDKFHYFGYNAALGTLDTLRVTSAGSSHETVLNRLGNSEGFADSITYSPSLRQYESIGALHQSYSRTFNVSGVNSKLGVKTSLDAAGRISGRLNVSADTLRAFTYDSLGRLRYDLKLHLIGSECTPHQAAGAGCVAEDSILFDAATFAYDAVGNPTNVILSDEGNRLYVVNGDTLSYDDEGNLIQRKNAVLQTLSWNSLGQLASVTTNGVTVAYGYDAGGRRIRRTQGTDVVGYLWDGGNVSFEFDASGAPTREYSYWGIDRPHAVRTGGDVYYYTQDLVGQSVRGLIRRSDNAVVAHYDYGAFGALLPGSFDNVGNSMRFAGREHDPVTGLYYVRARYYDPKHGRFISEDPAGLDAGVNLYTYAGNDPVNFRDPSGLTVTSTETCYTPNWISGGLGEYLVFVETLCLGSNATPTPDDPPNRTPPPNDGQPARGGGAGNPTCSPYLAGKGLCSPGPTAGLIDPGERACMAAGVYAWTQAAVDAFVTLEGGAILKSVGQALISEARIGIIRLLANMRGFAGAQAGALTRAGTAAGVVASHSYGRAAAGAGLAATDDALRYGTINLPIVSARRDFTRFGRECFGG